MENHDAQDDRDADVERPRELALLIEPIVLGGGKTIFPDNGVAQRFELTDMERASTGVICTRYVRAT